MEQLEIQRQEQKTGIARTRISASMIGRADRSYILASAILKCMNGFKANHNAHGSSLCATCADGGQNTIYGSLLHKSKTAINRLSHYQLYFSHLVKISLVGS